MQAFKNIHYKLITVAQNISQKIMDTCVHTHIYTHPHTFIHTHTRTQICCEFPLPLNST